MWSTARPSASAPAVIFEKGACFFSVSTARPRYANVMRTVLLEPTVPAGFVLSFLGL